MSIHVWLSLLVTATAVVAAPRPTLTAAQAREQPAARPTPAPVPAMPVFTSVDCHYKYCDGMTSWCFYWAGVTTYDLSLGPLPGETRTPLGHCTVRDTLSVADPQPTPA
jgi:hypothetical protein